MLNRSLESRCLQVDHGSFRNIIGTDLQKVGTGERIYGELIGTHLSNIRKELLDYWQPLDSYITGSNWVGEDHFIRLGGKEGHLYTILDSEDAEDKCGKVIINVKVAIDCIKKGYVTHDDILDHLDGII